MKLVSWNVNGLRACMKKGFMDFFREADADVFCIQETKMSRDQGDFDFGSHYEFWNSAEKKGYSGTAVFCKHEPASVSYGIGMENHDNEGRVITLDFGDFYLVNCYTPNSQDGLRRLEYRMDWEDCFREYLMRLDNEKPLILCGDLNVAHKEIDLKNPKTNTKNAGFTPEERGKMTQLLSSGFADSFRLLYPELTGAYTWWSYRSNARANNAGWRIDYFVVSDSLRGRVRDSLICPDVQGSDHCPVCLELSD